MKKIITGYTTMVKEIRKKDNIICIKANEETLSYIPKFKSDESEVKESYSYIAIFTGIPVYQDNELGDDEFSIEIKETLQDKLNNQRYSKLDQELRLLLEKEKSLKLSIDSFKADNDFERCIDLNKQLIETQRKITKTFDDLKFYDSILKK